MIPNLMKYKPLNLLDSIFQTKKLDINKIRQLQIFLLLGNAPDDMCLCYSVKTACLSSTTNGKRADKTYLRVKGEDVINS